MRIVSFAGYIACLAVGVIKESLVENGGIGGIGHLTCATILLGIAIYANDKIV